MVVGGSDAGIAAALRVREVDPRAEVDVVVADSLPNFSLCGLPTGSRARSRIGETCRTAAAARPKTQGCISCGRRRSARSTRCGGPWWARAQRARLRPSAGSPGYRHRWLSRCGHRFVSLDRWKTRTSSHSPFGAGRRQSAPGDRETARHACRPSTASTRPAPLPSRASPRRCRTTRTGCCACSRRGGGACSPRRGSRPGSRGLRGPVPPGRHPTHLRHGSSRRNQPQSTAPGLPRRPIAARRWPVGYGSGSLAQRLATHHWVG